MSTNKHLTEQYEALGKRWLNGEVDIEDFNGIKFNDKQKEFVNARERFVLMSGGFASGKTTGFIVKLWLLAMFFPGNRILLGRKTRQDVERATLPDIFDIFPQGTYEHKVGPGKIEFPNGSEILFFGLDALQSGAGQDIKKAEQAIKSLNLGAFFIDQLEEIELKVFQALDGRLRRNIPFRQSNSTTNPANFWAYDYFKANPRPNTRLIETSMMDNKANLPEDYIQSQLNQPERYVRRYVYGEWSPDSLVESGVFSEYVIKEQEMYVKNPIREFDGIKIFQEPEKHEYQIGVDPSIGSQDPGHICVIDKETGEEVANFTGFVNTEVLVEKTVQLALMYSLVKKPLVVPEVTGVGQAFVESLKKVYDKIYEREVFNQREKKTTKKLGFYTNYATKVQLVEHMKKLFQKKFPKIRDKATVEELKVFIYTDEARQKGAGAQAGYRDDRVMGKMLAYWNIEAQTPREKTLLDRLTGQKKKKVISYQYN
jgi:hypothetical protein